MSAFVESLYRIRRRALVFRFGLSAERTVEDVESSAVEYAYFRPDRNWLCICRHRNLERVEEGIPVLPFDLLCSSILTGIASSDDTPFMRTFDPRTIRILRGVLLVPHFERIGESYHWSEMSVIFDRVSNSSAISSSPFSFAIWKMRFSSLSVYDNE